MNKLVKEGIELDHAYSYKFCSPTRSCLQSGRLVRSPPPLLLLALLTVRPGSAARPRERAEHRPRGLQPSRPGQRLRGHPAEQ